MVLTPERPVDLENLRGVNFLKAEILKLLHSKQKSATTSGTSLISVQFIKKLQHVPMLGVDFAVCFLTM